ncbi:MAG: DUF3375 domain-containing protein [Nakamurella sp.]
MEFDELTALRKNSAAWRLLRADHAPLVLAFLGRVFVGENIRSISQTDLAGRLDDELYAVNERSGETVFPKSPKAYLDDWSASDVGWLRKFYPPGVDEPHFDATPAVEKALTWVEALRERSFVGTESRLNTVFELLRQMVFGAETDPAVRIAELRRQRDAIDADIARLEGGHLDVMDPVAQRDRYQQFATVARELLADFREVEENFRRLDRDLRERIAGWTGAKGELLDDILGSRATITKSDQGRSFHAFYDFLLSAAKQEEFTELLAAVSGLPDVGELDPRMRTIHHDWLDAGERTQATVRLLSEQLRRFLDDQVWLENRRVVDLLRSIESSALAVRDVRAPTISMEIDDTVPTLVLPMERPLYSPAARMAMESATVAVGDTEFDATALFEQVFVDPQRLARAVRRSLERTAQVGLETIVGIEPLTQGLAELVTYLSLSDDAFTVVFDEQATEQVHWSDADGSSRVATLPRVTFVSRRTEGTVQ